MLEDSQKAEDVLVSLKCAFFIELIQYQINKEDYQEAIKSSLQLLLLTSNYEQTKMIKEILDGMRSPKLREKAN
ncbi:hypothetical protein GCM10010913_24170 [Paenibacillus aceti]|uniref:Uncharacterized protein n=1 Tax=Paenibacillus aceti TaxID=1820010 RepID=A0ABQ1VVL5_9BACL|nr:hypothetical protein GCM10010913_24170 [Paenibacillus aceti]